MVEQLTFNQVVGGSNPPCLIPKSVKSRVSGPEKSKVTKKVTKVTKKIDSRKGKELEFCTRGMVLAFFIEKIGRVVLINVYAFGMYLEQHKVE